MSLTAGKPYFLYILWSPQLHRFYIGLTEDPSARHQTHLHGKSPWTSRANDWQQVLVERFESYALARLRERELSPSPPTSIASIIKF